MKISLTQLKEDLNTSLTDSVTQAEELSALRVDLSNAEERERESHRAQEALQKEHEQQMQELEEKVHVCRLANILQLERLVWHCCRKRNRLLREITWQIKSRIINPNCIFVTS